MRPVINIADLKLDHQDVGERYESADTSFGGLDTSVPVLNEGGGGLLGMALALDFGETGHAYFYHTYASDTGPQNRVIQAQFADATWRESDVLLDGIPGHRLYNGGRIAIGPDDQLYVTTGWIENRELPQDLGSLAGKILRLAVDGSVPPDNPFPGSPVYSYGHRNPHGLAWDEDGVLCASEHGQSALDEINRIAAGQNYGWPLVSGDESASDMQAPLLHSGSQTSAPSGIAFSTGNSLSAHFKLEASTQ